MKGCEGSTNKLEVYTTNSQAQITLQGHSHAAVTPVSLGVEPMACPAHTEPRALPEGECRLCGSCFFLLWLLNESHVGASSGAWHQPQQEAGEEFLSSILGGNRD